MHGTTPTSWWCPACVLAPELAQHYWGPLGRPNPLLHLAHVFLVAILLRLLPLPIRLLALHVALAPQQKVQR